MGVSGVRNLSTDRQTQVSPSQLHNRKLPHTRYCNEAKPESKKREQGTEEGGNTRAGDTSLQPVLSRLNACDHSCKGGLWQPFIWVQKGGFASADPLFTQQCLARPPSSTGQSFRDVSESSAKGLSSHKADVRTRCHTNAPASPPRHPPTTHGRALCEAQVSRARPCSHFAVTASRKPAPSQRAGLTAPVTTHLILEPV